MSNIYLIPLLILSIFTLGLHATNGFFYNIHMNIVPENGWERLCFWIKENSLPTDFFIAPPYKSGFHLYAERAELVNFRSNLFFEKDIVKWKERLEDVLKVDDIFNTERKGWNSLNFMKERYNSLSEDEIRNLAEKYKADYIIFEKPKAILCEIFYENGYYTIYKINKKE